MQSHNKMANNKMPVLDAMDTLIEEFKKNLTSNSHINVTLCNMLLGSIQKVKDAENKKLHPQHKRRWTDHENERILAMYGNGETPASMARELGRTLRATDYQLSRLLIQETQVHGYETVAMRYNRTVDDVRSKVDTVHNADY